MNARVVCTKCNKDDGYLNMGNCLRDHPEFTKKVIDEEDGDPIYADITGTTSPFSEIDSNKLNELIVFKAKVISTSDILNYDITRVYRCPECGNERTFKCTDFREFSENKIMCDCGKSYLKLDKHQTITGNLRKVILQETMDEMGINPRRIEAEVVSHFVFELQAGKDYTFEANVWSRKIGKENVNKFVLNVTRLRCIDENTAVLPTDTEIKVFANVSPLSVVNSVAPHIKYRAKEKLAGLIMMLSGGIVDGIRGDLSVMFCGDPSTGKSQILDALVSLDNRSQKVSGRSASAAGLVMGVDNLSDGTRMATFGPVILCHKHFVAIDEGDKMRPEDRSALHDVMESQVAHLNKVGINLTVPAETKIIMACNPKASKYDKEGTIKANIGMPESFLQRFGYIFLLLDNFPREQERECIRHINKIKQLGLDKVIEDDGLLKHDELIKFINHAKTFKPKMKDVATEKLEDMYIKLKYLKQESGSLDIDKRSYYDILRASYAFARLRFSNEVDIVDVNNAWKLKLDALESFGMNTQGDFLQSQLVPEFSDERKQFITESCHNCLDENGMVTEYKLLVLLQSNKKYCRTLEDAVKIVTSLKNTGLLLAGGTEGVYKLVE